MIRTCLESKYETGPLILHGYRSDVGFGRFLLGDALELSKLE
jgi:hypothetical protein